MHSNHRRDGVAAVEAALVSPLILLLLIGMIDVGQYVNVAQTVSNASREGMRIACRNRTQTVSEVQIAVEDYFLDAFPNLARKEVQGAMALQVLQGDGSPISAGDLTTVSSGSEITVRVSLDFASVRWLRGVAWWDTQSKQAVTFGRRE